MEVKIKAWAVEWGVVGWLQEQRWEKGDQTSPEDKIW